MIETGSERGPRKSVLAVQHDDNDVFCKRFNHETENVFKKSIVLSIKKKKKSAALSSKKNQPPFSLKKNQPPFPLKIIKELKGTFAIIVY